MCKELLQFHGVVAESEINAWSLFSAVLFCLALGTIIAHCTRVGTCCRGPHCHLNVGWMKVWIALLEWQLSLLLNTKILLPYKTMQGAMISDWFPEITFMVLLRWCDLFLCKAVRNFSLMLNLLFHWNLL